MNSEWLALGIEFLVQSLFLVIALWIMLKIQKLDYHFGKLVGAAALASGLDMIPYVGHYIAVGVLLFTMTKVTRSDYTDVVFTVAVGYALMFGMNLFLLGAMLGDLRPSAKPDETVEAKLLQQGRESDGDTEPALPEPEPASAVTSNAPVTVAAQPVSKTTNSPASGFSLKGLTSNGNKSLATISTGVKTYTIGLGESMPMQTANGKVTVTLEKVNAGSVILNIGGERSSFSQ